MEKWPPLGRSGVDIACQHLERLLLLLEFVGGFDDLLEGSRQPGESPDHQGVAGTHVFERGFEFRAVAMRAGRFLDVEPLTRNCSPPPPGCIKIMFIKGLSIQTSSEPILSILERSAWV